MEGVGYLYFKGRVVVNKEIILVLVLKQVNLFLLNCVTVTQKNVILNAVYRPPNGDFKTCKTYLKNVLITNNNSNENFVLAGGFNINMFDFNVTKKCKISLIYCFDLA